MSIENKKYNIKKNRPDEHGEDSRRRR